MRAAPARRESTGRDLRGVSEWSASRSRSTGGEPLGPWGRAGALTPVQAISGRHDGLREGRDSVLRGRGGRWTSQLSRRREELGRVPRKSSSSGCVLAKPPVTHQPQHHSHQPHTTLAQPHMRVREVTANPCRSWRGMLARRLCYVALPCQLRQWMWAIAKICSQT